MPIFLVADGDVAIIDSGITGSAPKIVEALWEIGKRPKDVRHILLTHLHPDRTGSAKALNDAVAADGGAVQIYMHPTDAALFARVEVMRPVKLVPGLSN